MRAKRGHDILERVSRAADEVIERRADLNSPT